MPMTPQIPGREEWIRPRGEAGGVSSVLRNGCLAILMLVLGLPFGVAQGQMLDARRLGMGGVVTSDVGDYTGSNIAFRAVPKGTGGSGSIPLPLGLIQYLADHPTFDSKDSTFNIYEVANVLLNPPLTIKLWQRSEEHTSELQSPCNLVCRLLLEKKKRGDKRPDVLRMTAVNANPHAR